MYHNAGQTSKSFNFSHCDVLIVVIFVEQLQTFGNVPKQRFTNFKQRWLVGDKIDLKSNPNTLTYLYILKKYAANHN